MDRIPNEPLKSCVTDWGVNTANQRSITTQQNAQRMEDTLRWKVKTTHDNSSIAANNLTMAFLTYETKEPVLSKQPTRCKVKIDGTSITQIMENHWYFLYKLWEFSID